MRRYLGAMAAVAAWAIAIGASAGIAEARPGDLDPAFGTGGIASRGFGVESQGRSAGSAIEPIGIQPGGEPVAAGTATLSDCGGFGCFVGLRRFVAARLADDGSLDPTFGSGGRVVTSFGLGDRAAFPDSAMLPDGGMVVVAIQQAGSAVYVFHLTANGALDGAFAGDGRAELTPSAGFDPIDARVAVQSDGRPVVAVLARNGTTSGNERDLFRLEADGTLDPGFAAGGPQVDSARAFEQLGTLLVDSQDRLILGEDYQATGPPIQHQVISRYLPDGTPDPAFGPGGTSVQPDVLAAAAAAPRLAVDAADRILSLSRGRFVARLRADGTLDPAFGDGGVADLGERDLTAVAAAPDGGVLVAGAISRLGAGGSTLLLGKLLPNGTPDGRLGTGGFSTVYPRGDAAGAGLLPIAADRVLLATGQEQGTGALFARYRLDQSPPDDLDADGVLDPADGCPGRYEPGKGCPSYKRKLTMHRDGRRRVRGNLFTSVSGCADGVRIRFFRKVKGPDRAVGKALTGDSTDGAIFYTGRLRRPVLGVVYATVAPRLDPATGLCLSAKSPGVRP